LEISRGFWKGASRHGRFFEDFLTLLLDDDTSLEDKITEIKAYTQKVERDGKTSQQVSESFVGLKDNVKIFRKEWYTLVERIDAEYIVALDKSIEDLEAGIRELNRKVFKIIDEIKLFTTLPNVVTIAALLPSLFQDALYESLKSSSAAQYLQKEIQAHDDIIKSLKEKRLEREQHAANWKASIFIQVLEEGKRTESDFLVVCDKVSVLTSVFGTIQADLQSIEEQLVNGRADSSKALFKARMNATAQIYATISEALRQYQVVVTLDK